MSETKRFAYFKEVAIGASVGALVLALVIVGFSISGVAGLQTPGPSSSPSNSSSVVPPTATAAACLVTPQLSDSRLGNIQALVVNAANDQVLLDVNGQTASATASTMKLLTAAAAMQILGPNYRVATHIYRDPTDPSVIYFVGSGDPTITRVGPGKQSVYQNAPRLSDLAVQVNKALGTTPITKIVTDSTMFGGPQWLPSVDPAERTNGYLGLVSALEVDGDRNDPAKETSPRSATPELRAGTWLKQALGASATGATVLAGKLPTNATAIATVQSQPISNWINHMLAVSDNTQAEYLARLVSLAQNMDGSFASVDASTKKALSSLGLDASGSVILDGSGESPENAVSPAFMVKLVKQIFLASGNLAIVKQSLPVSGESGSLQNRFKGDNIDAVGKVFAKTGWIVHGYTLAGYITAKDGSNLLFAIYALGPKVENSAKDAIDALATGIYRCGADLGNSTPTPAPTN